MKFTKKGNKWTTEIDQEALDTEILGLRMEMKNNDAEATILNKANAELAKKIKSLEFIKSQLK